MRIAVGVLSRKASGTIGGDQRHAEALEEAEAGLLDNQIAGEPVRRLDDDGPDAIAGDALEHRGKARARVHRVRARNAIIAELGDDLEAGHLRVSLNRGALALERVLVGPNVRQRRGPKIGYRLKANFCATRQLHLD